MNRPLDEASHPDETLVDVSDFSLDPGDLTPALARALEHARSVPGPKRVVVPPGVYHVHPDHAPVREFYVSNTVGSREEHRDKRIAILLEDLCDVTIDGEGATLVMHGQQTLFAMIRTRRASIRGFAVDWVTPRAIDLTVIHSGPDHHDLLVPAGYRYQICGTEVTWLSEDSSSGQPHWVYHRPEPLDVPLPDLGYDFMQITDLQTGRAHGGTMLDLPNPLRSGLVSVREIAPGVLRHTYGEGGSPSALGTVFQLRRTMRDTPGALLWEAKDSVIADMDIGYLHGFGMIAQMTDSVTVRGVRFRAPAGSRRTTVGFADLVQISGDKGTVVIEDNDFGFSHDDAINIHNTYVQLVAVDGNVATFRFMHHETSGFPLFHPGDTVALVDRDTMLDLPWAGTVIDVHGPSGQDHSVDLENVNLTFDEPLPDAAIPGRVVAENLTYNPAVAVRRNRFQSIATRGMLVTTRGSVVIEDNRFERVEMASIYVSADASQWYESSVVRDLVIRNNVFIRSATSTKAKAEILVEPTAAGEDPSKAAHSGIVIRDNVFLSADIPVLDARSVSGISFTGNTIVRYGADPPGEPTPSGPLAIVRGCTAVQFRGNATGQGVSQEVTCHAMEVDDLIVEGFVRLEPPQAPLAALESVETEGLRVPPLPWPADSVVVRLPDDLARIRISFKPVDGHPVRLAVHGIPVEPDADGWLAVPLESGATVVECEVEAPVGVPKRLYRCVLLRAS